MKKIILASVFVIILMIFVSAFFFYSLPDSMVSHWGMQSEPNGWMPKAFFFVFFIGLAIGIFLLMVFLPKADPFKKNYAAFQKEYDLLVFFFACFMFYIFLMVIWANLGYALNMGLAMIPALAVLFYVIGILIGKTKRNYFVGIRTPWALDNEDNWNKTHKFGAKVFKALALLILVIWLFGIFFDKAEKALFPVTIGTILVAAFFPFLYSYLLYAKNQKTRSK
jgi:uncharacterized membrane protein